MTNTHHAIVVGGIPGVHTARGALDDAASARRPSRRLLDRLGR